MKTKSEFSSVLSDFRFLKDVDNETVKLSKRSSLNKLFKHSQHACTDFISVSLKTWLALSAKNRMGYIAKLSMRTKWLHFTDRCMTSSYTLNVRSRHKTVWNLCLRSAWLDVEDGSLRMVGCPCEGPGKPFLVDRAALQCWGSFFCESTHSCPVMSNAEGRRAVMESLAKV